MSAHKYLSLKDERTYKRVREHIRNIKDRITEEDIMNIRTNFTGRLVKKVYQVVKA